MLTLLHVIISRFIRTSGRLGRWLFVAAGVIAVVPVLAEFRITGIKRNDADVAIAFEAEQGVTYSLERRPNLNTSVWQSVAGVNDFTATSNGPAQFTDSGAVALGQGFYRVNAARVIFVDALGGNDSNPGNRLVPKLIMRP
jgi:hypothetical protein